MPPYSRSPLAVDTHHTALDAAADEESTTERRVARRQQKASGSQWLLTANGREIREVNQGRPSPILTRPRLLLLPAFSHFSDERRRIEKLDNEVEIYVLTLSTHVQAFSPEHFLFFSPHRSQLLFRSSIVGEKRYANLSSRWRGGAGGDPVSACLSSRQHRPIQVGATLTFCETRQRNTPPPKRHAGFLS